MTKTVYSKTYFQLHVYMQSRESHPMLSRLESIKEILLPELDRIIVRKIPEENISKFLQQLYEASQE